MTDDFNRKIDSTSTSRAGNAQGTSRLGRLDELDDFEIADGEPDIRGWTVKAKDGTEIGEVSDLIADTAAREVRYVEVEVKDELLDESAKKMDHNHVLIPIRAARLDDDGDTVFLNGVESSQFRDAPRFGREPITDEHEKAILVFFGQPTTGARSPDIDDSNRFFGKRREGREKEQYLTLSEERLDTDKQRVQKGEVHVSKSVETRHVEKEVPTMREEVNIERRPARAGASSSAEIHEDEITIPLMGEEVTVDKKIVPREEVVISKSAVRGTKTVEADLRSEKLDVDRNT